MRLTLLTILGLGFILSSSGQDQKKENFVGPVHFKKVKVSSETYESVGVFDVNGDGKPDLVSGAFWYEGPDYVQRHFISEVKRVDEYWDEFMHIPMDVNGDGKMDYITGGWFAGTLYWMENPGDNGHWKKHRIDSTGNIETARGFDLDGDGNLEIIPNNPGHPLKYYKLITDSNGKGTGQFSKVDVAPTQGHGMGFGDVNGDKRIDIIVNNGWLEAPKDLKGKWTLHQEFDFGDASIPVLVLEIKKDGINDLIVGQAHSYGLRWYEQKIDSDGKRDWIEHPIDLNNSQYHTMEWVDIDGDGEEELITGKRYRAHNGKDPGANDPIGLYYFKWNGESFTKNIISYGPFDQGKGAGIYFSVTDLMNTGRKDIIVGGKDGLYIFYNEGRK
ncbi:MULTISPECIES: FG-GAP repeat domain-containing protein [Sphingobacterium]|uniref:FG-GAP repeat domain-containing protein n=1 Tax=Sphingobacterium TaxID=28453 RepID=UPI0038FCAAB7